MLQKLRSESTARNLPVLMLSAKADEIDRVVGLEMGDGDCNLQRGSLWQGLGLFYAGPMLQAVCKSSSPSMYRRPANVAMVAANCNIRQ